MSITAGSQFLKWINNLGPKKLKKILLEIILENHDSENKKRVVWKMEKDFDDNFLNDIYATNLCWSWFWICMAVAQIHFWIETLLQKNWKEL